MTAFKYLVFIFKNITKQTADLHQQSDIFRYFYLLINTGGVINGSRPYDDVIFAIKFDARLATF